jgi:hypothetical protein
MSIVHAITALKAADPTLVGDMSLAMGALVAQDGAADPHAWLGCSARERARGPVIMLARLDTAQGVKRAGVAVLIDGTLDLLVSSSVGGEFLPLMDIEMNVHGLEPAMRLLDKDDDPVRSALVARLEVAAQKVVSARTAA